MTKKAQNPRPPADLSARSRKLWTAVLRDFELSDAEIEVLRGALVALDRADQAAVIIKAEGMVCTDRYGSPKAHPAVDIELRNRALSARLTGQLGVKLTEETPARRLGGKPGPKPRRLRAVG